MADIVARYGINIDSRRMTTLALSWRSVKYYFPHGAIGNQVFLCFFGIQPQGTRINKARAQDRVVLFEGQFALDRVQTFQQSAAAARYLDRLRGDQAAEAVACVQDVPSDEYQTSFR